MKIQRVKIHVAGWPSSSVSASAGELSAEADRFEYEVEIHHPDSRHRRARHLPLSRITAGVVKFIPVSALVAQA